MGCFLGRKSPNYADNAGSPAFKAGEFFPFFTSAQVEYVGYGLQIFVSC